MSNQQPLTKLKLPQWTWRDSGWWLTVFGAVFVVVIFVQPSISGHSFWKRLGISLAWFVLSPILLLVAQYAVEVGSVLINRLRAYDNLHDVAEQQAEHLARAQETILQLSQELTNGRKFEIAKTIYYNETLYLALKKKRGIKLEVGHKIRVIDTMDGGIMGMFQVNEIRSDGYRAKADYVDPVWLGFVYQSGKGETSAPPNGVAIFFP